jgi:hypothetical protein
LEVHFLDLNDKEEEAKERKTKNGKYATKQLLVCHLPREKQINALIKESTTNGWRLERNF